MNPTVSPHRRTFADKFLVKNGLNSEPIKIDLKQGDALTPLLFNFALEYGIRTVRDNQVELKLNRTHQLLVYADDVNLLGDNMASIEKNTEILIGTSKGGWSRSKRRVYVVLSSPECREIHDIKRGNRCFENVEQFRYLGTTITNQNLILGEIKRRLN
jgi:hypothetical protein